MIKEFKVPGENRGKSFYAEKGYPEVYVETARSEFNKYDTISIERDTEREINDVLQALGLHQYAVSWDFDTSTLTVGPFTESKLYGFEDAKRIIIKQNTCVLRGPWECCWNVETIDIPNTVHEISLWCMNYLEKLETVFFHNNPTIIFGDYAFSDCHRLKTISGLSSSSINGIGKAVFAGCESLENVPIPTSYDVVTIPERYASGTAIKTLPVPDNIKLIEYGAFACCPNLEAVYLGKGSERLGEKAFANCESLTIVKIPDSVKKIYENTFEGCGMFTVVCNPGSYAEAWANMMKIHVEYSGTL